MLHSGNVAVDVMAIFGASVVWAMVVLAIVAVVRGKWTERLAGQSKRRHRSRRTPRTH